MKRNARVTAEPVLARDLQPGDLFSTEGPTYWDYFPQCQSIAEKAYIRTATPPIFGDGKDKVFRLTITPTEEPN